MFDQCKTGRSGKINIFLSQKVYTSLPKDLEEGVAIYEYMGQTFGCVSPNGIAVCLKPGEYPFFEVPSHAITWDGQETNKSFMLKTTPLNPNELFQDEDFLNEKILIAKINALLMTEDAKYWFKINKEYYIPCGAVNDFNLSIVQKFFNRDNNWNVLKSNQPARCGEGCEKYYNGKFSYHYGFQIVDNKEPVTEEPKKLSLLQRAQSLFKWKSKCKLEVLE